MCNPFEEVTAYKDCKGNVHSTKLAAAASSIAENINCERSMYATSISKWNVEEILNVIIKSDKARSHFKDLIEDKDRERTAELTRLFCESSKSC